MCVLCVCACACVPACVHMHGACAHVSVPVCVILTLIPSPTCHLKVTGKLTVPLHAKMCQVFRTETFCEGEPFLFTR